MRSPCALKAGRACASRIAAASRGGVSSAAGSVEMYVVGAERLPHRNRTRSYPSARSTPIATPCTSAARTNVPGRLAKASRSHRRRRGAGAGALSARRPIISAKPQDGRRQRTPCTARTPSTIVSSCSHDFGHSWLPGCAAQRGHTVVVLLHACCCSSAVMPARVGRAPRRRGFARAGRRPQDG